MAFTITEYCDMMLLYGEFGRKVGAALAGYAVRFPDRRRPVPGTLLRLLHRAQETGSVLTNSRDVRGRTRSARNLKLEEFVVRYMADNPKASIRSIARTCNRSHSTIQRIVADEGREEASSSEDEEED